MAPGRHLLIDPSYVGKTEKVRARAAHTWFTGGDGGFACTAWVAAVEGAEGRRAHDGRLRADLNIGVDSASMVLLDEQGLGTLEAAPHSSTSACTSRSRRRVGPSCMCAATAPG